MSAPSKPLALLAEDDPQVAGLLTTLLKMEGYEVSMVETAAAAVAELGKAPAILITDFGLKDGPGKGISLIEEARKRNPALPVVMVTGNPGAAKPLLENLSGGDTVKLVGKPFSPLIFRETLKAAVKSMEPLAPPGVTQQEKLDDTPPGGSGIRM